MRTISLFGIACCCSLIFLPSISSPTASEKPATEKSSTERPHSALIVLEGAHTENGIGKFRAISIHNAKTVAKLETFFPNYKKRLSSDVAASWETSYHVYFNFRDGKAIYLQVSEGKEASWSIVSGDFDVVGNFDEFVKGLETSP